MGLSRSALLVLATWLGLGCTPAKPDEDDRSAPPPPPAGPSCGKARLALAAAEPTGGDAGQTVDIDACETRWVDGGTFPMGFSPKEVEPFTTSLDFKDLDHAVTVSGFFLDRFEITLGRFASFALDYSGAPAAGSGAHPDIAGSGWLSDWDRLVPVDQAALLSEVGISEDLHALLDSQAPMDRLSWFVAFAFCSSDAGRLPTEAEWEFAAAGGAENRPFPWGDDTSIAAGLRAEEPTWVGTHPATRGRFGQDDLAGGVYEWALDWLAEGFYVGRGAYCHDCANLATGTGRVVRGAPDPNCCAGLNTAFRAAARAQQAPGSILPRQGARCARDP